MSKTKTVLGRTLEEIKEEVSREFLNPYRTWLENSRFSNDDNISVLEDSGAIDEVVKRYAQSQTQELQEKNAELVDSLSKLVLLLEEIDSTLFHHNHSIDGWHLNGDLEPIMNFVNDMDLEPITEAKEILTKNNHLNKK